jgi:hypothetical protein
MLVEEAGDRCVLNSDVKSRFVAALLQKEHCYTYRCAVELTTVRSTHLLLIHTSSG